MVYSVCPDPSRKTGKHPRGSALLFSAVIYLYVSAKIRLTRSGKMSHFRNVIPLISNKNFDRPHPCLQDEQKVYKMKTYVESPSGPVLLLQIRSSVNKCFVSVWLCCIYSTPALTAKNQHINTRTYINSLTHTYTEFFTQDELQRGLLLLYTARTQ